MWNSLTIVCVPRFICRDDLGRLTNDYNRLNQVTEKLTKFASASDKNLLEVNKQGLSEIELGSEAITGLKSGPSIVDNLVEIGKDAQWANNPAIQQCLNVANTVAAKVRAPNGRLDQGDIIALKAAADTLGAIMRGQIDGTGRTMQTVDAAALTMFINNDSNLKATTEKIATDKSKLGGGVDYQQIIRAYINSLNQQTPGSGNGVAGQLASDMAKHNVRDQIMVTNPSNAQNVAFQQGCQFLSLNASPGKGTPLPAFVDEPGPKGTTKHVAIEGKMVPFAAATRVDTFLDGMAKFLDNQGHPMSPVRKQGQFDQVAIALRQHPDLPQAQKQHALEHLLNNEQSLVPGVNVIANPARTQYLNLNTLTIPQLRARPEFTALQQFYTPQQLTDMSRPPGNDLQTAIKAQFLLAIANQGLNARVNAETARVYPQLGGTAIPPRTVEVSMAHGKDVGKAEGELGQENAGLGLDELQNRSIGQGTAVVNFNKPGGNQPVLLRLGTTAYKDNVSNNEHTVKVTLPGFSPITFNLKVEAHVNKVNGKTEYSPRLEPLSKTLPQGLTWHADTQTLEIDNNRVPQGNNAATISSQSRQTGAPTVAGTFQLKATISP